MANLSWAEVRERAVAFAKSWASESSEAASKQSFWNDFFQVFGRERRTVAAFEVAVKNLKGKFNHIDLLWKGVLLVEHKSAGKSLDAAESQAFDYIADLSREGRHSEVPRYVILSDFEKIALFDLEPDEQLDLPLFAGIRYHSLVFPLADLSKYARQFAFIKGERTKRLDPEDPANDEAYDLMCKLHDELHKAGFQGNDLERLLVRVLFCLFADDTEVFEPESFESFINNHTREDGSDVGARLSELFDLLNRPESTWPESSKDTFFGFRYINGELFKDRLAFPPFTRETRKALLDACGFHWDRVSPAVFGSLFQGIMDKKARRQRGAHYTSERDILKVINSLFMDDLRAEFDAIKSDSRKGNRQGRLTRLHEDIRKLRFFDPACGCGNFLVIAYRELRQLELEILMLLREETPQMVLNVRDLILVDVDQFYGIEYSEWPARIAEVAMWLMDHQMNRAVSHAFGPNFERLPLQTSPHIVYGNALRLPWKMILKPSDDVFVLGNPPFVGKHLMNAEQEADMDLVWPSSGVKKVKRAGVLDYVTGWYLRAAEYIAGTKIRVAFVSTNSITQGEQVDVLWSELFKKWGVKIHFGHRTFTWKSESRGSAQVHVVIIGFASFDIEWKKLYDYEDGDGHVTVSRTKNISPYLISGSDLTLPSRSKPICDVPAVVYGSKPVDNGNLIVEEVDREAFISQNKPIEPYLKAFLCADEFLHGIPRWALWLRDAPPKVINSCPGVRQRIDNVRVFRLGSTKAPTVKQAATPTVFAEVRQPKSEFIVIPMHSSERRKYVPFAYFGPEVIIGNSCTAIANATHYHFGVITSIMHVAWLRIVGGRIKSDFRYSNTLVYNNFPWPVSPTDKQKQAVEAAARQVLEERALHLPPNGESSLADLYDRLSMPPGLSVAHAKLDRAVELCYRPAKFESDRDRVEFLFALYESMDTPLVPPTRKKSRSPRTSKQT